MAIMALLLVRPGKGLPILIVLRDWGEKDG
eukprot:COSAG02_NODE_23783_length_708_cov_1.238095_1_plen_29_part_10